MRVLPRCKEIPAFLAGSRPARLHKRRKREHDDRRLRWYSRYLADDGGEMARWLGHG